MDQIVTEFFQSISNPFLDWFFYIISLIGGEIGFLVIIVLVFWILDKKLANRLMLTFLFSGIVNIGVKSAVKRPRPYDAGYLMPDVPGVETSGYSMPSGHAQNAAIVASTIVIEKKRNKLLIVIGIVFAILVSLSRVYLAQHYLSDVLVGLLVGTAMTVVMYYVVKLMKNKEHIVNLCLIPTSLVSAIFIDHEQAAMFCGAFIGFAIGYFIEKKYINYEISANYKIIILKLLLGGVITVGLYFLMNLIIPSDIAQLSAITYGVLGLWATAGAPSLFKILFKNNPAISKEAVSE